MTIFFQQWTNLEKEGVEAMPFYSTHSNKSRQNVRFCHSLIKVNIYHAVSFKTDELWWDTPGPDPVHPKIPAVQLVPLIGHLVLLGTPRRWHRHCLHLGAFGAWTRHPHFPSHRAQRVAEVRTVASSGKVSGAPAVEGMYDHRHFSQYFYTIQIPVSAGVKVSDLSVNTFTVYTGAVSEDLSDSIFTVYRYLCQ